MENKKILFIEDDENLIKSFKGFIENEGFQFFSATDGEKGLESAREIRPDLILLDLILPKKNGFTVLKEVKDDNDLKETPVIILTNLEDEKDIEKTLSLGAYTYLIKANYSLNDIIKKIKEALQ